MIEVSDLHKSFGPVHAVAGLNFDAMDGRITGLIGANGAGKTTTFRMIDGMLTPESGRILVDGLDVVTDRVAAQRRLGILPDVRGLYPRLTGREHIRYYGSLRGMAGPGLEANIDKLIAGLGMAEFADRRTKGFSAGQQLKVALGRALVHQPRNLILDEPTNGLDVISSRAVRQLLREMRDNGHCILLSSHIMAEVSVLCDWIIIIDNGRTVMEGTPDDLRAHTGAQEMEDVFVSAMDLAAADGRES
jgi:sodium transport system ATP-binding protein